MVPDPSDGGCHADCSWRHTGASHRTWCMSPSWPVFGCRNMGIHVPSDRRMPKESEMSPPLLRSFRFSSDNLQASTVVKITAISFSCVHHEDVMDGRLKRIGKIPLALSKNTILVATQTLLKPCVMNHETSSFHQKQLDAQSKLGICIDENSSQVDRWRKSPLSYGITMPAPKWRSWATLATQKVK